MTSILTFLAQVKNCTQEQASEAASGCLTTLPEVKADADTMRLILQLVFAGIAAAAVIYILITGLKMITSQGEPQAVAKARQSIIFAAVGLAVVLSAEIIVTFVIRSA